MNASKEVRSYVPINCEGVFMCTLDVCVCMYDYRRRYYARWKSDANCEVYSCEIVLLCTVRIHVGTKTTIGICVRGFFVCVCVCVCVCLFLPHFDFYANRTSNLTEELVISLQEVKGKTAKYLVMF